MIVEGVHRGDIWWVFWEPGRGSEQRGYRPALVIQNDVGNELARTTIVAAVTTSPRRLRVTVPITSEESGLPEASTVNLAHILTIDKSRLDRYAGRLAPEAMTRVDQVIRVSLGLSR